MSVYLLIREDQNEHGFVDTSITGAFRDESVAREHEWIERQKAREQGLIVESDDSGAGEWQVSWAVEEYVVM